MLKNFAEDILSLFLLALKACEKAAIFSSKVFSLLQKDTKELFKV